MPVTRVFFRQPVFRRRSAAFLATMLAAAGVFVGAAWPASAARVDLTVNVTSNRGSYSVDQSAVYTVRVDNRSDQATAAGARATLDVPNMLNSGAAWETSASAVQTGGGASAPSSFTRSADGRMVTATLPAVPAGGWVSYRLTAPGNPANGIVGALTVTATVTTASGDTDVDEATDTATVGVVIMTEPADYATSIAGYPTAGVADGATITADVALVNRGVRNNLRSVLTLAGDLGAGSRLVSAQLRSGPAVVPALTSDTSGRIDVGDLPAGSTSIVRVTIAVGQSCNAAGTPRTMKLTSAIAPSGGAAEAVALNGDNTAVATFSVLTPACLQSDVRTDSLVQTTPTSGALPHAGPFAFRADYTNTGPDTAPSTIRFSLGWATGEGGPSLDADPVCVATGGAVCPTSWQITPTVTPGTPGSPTSRGQSGVAAVGTGALVPTGGTLTITYTGTGGAADNLICGDPAGSALTSITAAPSFTDAVPTNNFINLAAGEQIGITCGIDHDFRLTVPWYRNDPNGTPLPQTTVDFQPGDTAYFDITGLNASNPDQGGLGVAGTAPYVDLNGYTQINRFGANVPANFSSGNQQFDLSDPGNVFWQSDTGTMPVDPGTLSAPMLSDNPLNITCQSDAPVVCPDTAVRQATIYPGVHPYPLMLNLDWSKNAQTVLPAGDTLRLLAAFKIPDLPEQYQRAGCVPQGVLINGSPTATSVSLPFYLVSVGEQTTKLSGDASPSDDRWRGVTIQVNYTRCTQDLAISQTIVDDAEAPISSPTLPADRTVRYAVTIVNPAGSGPLALPRFTEAFSPTVASATARCDPALSTGGAVCPTGTFTAGTRYLADRSTEPIGSGDPQFDITWGEQGQPTLPAGSSVTFLVEAHYPAETTTTATATATAFDAAPGSPFPLVSDSDAVAPTTSSAILSIRKSVSPINPHPGDTVSFTVDLLNAGTAATTAYFLDELHPDLRAANPDGFAHVACTPVTTSMNLLDGTLGSTPCPTLTSDATGIHATISDFAPNSGLQITYTAIAPTTLTSTPNIATLYANASIATLSDRSARVNFLVQAVQPTIPRTPTTPATPTAPTTPAASQSHHGQDLASTGVDAIRFELIGIGLLVIGAALLTGLGIAARRRARS